MRLRMAFFHMLKKNNPTFLFCVLLALTLGLVWVATTGTYSLVKTLFDEESQTSWTLRFLLTIYGYATIFVPGYFIISYIRQNKLHDMNGCMGNCFRMLINGNTLRDDEEGLSLHETEDRSNDIPSNQNLSQRALRLIFFCTGLQVSYLTWGVLQERIMTRAYTNSEGTVERFTDSQFLVFVNRILAFAFSGIYLMVESHHIHRTPLYKYSFCSVSNTLSSWCQYEALKFVSFPTQVLTKSAKVIPVMLMGKLVSRTQYKNYEYGTAILISIGMAAFLMGSSEGDKANISTTISGVVLLVGYLLFDSFTANWQSALFKEHKPSSVQMMCGVNLMSCIFTSASLIQQGGFFYSIGFGSRYPRFIWDCLLTAITSASGQLFIFATISNFGPVVFTIIMTVRQCLSILVSCLYYGHAVSFLGVMGVGTVFLAVFLRIYLGQQDKKAGRKVPSEVSPTTKV